MERGATEHIETIGNCLQGCGVQVRPAEAGGLRFSAAIDRVLSDSQYTRAAQALSRKLRARKNTPVEEAAGAGLSLRSPQCHQSLYACLLNEMCQEFCVS